MNRIGFLVNPVAGMGGAVGLKGTDGCVADARERGAVPVSPEKARRFLQGLIPGMHTLLTAGGVMGGGSFGDRRNLRVQGYFPACLP